MPDEEPKQRYISMDRMLLSYLGDYLKNMEQGVIHQAINEINNRTHQEESPVGR
jgi:hypothetical protein